MYVAMVRTIMEMALWTITVERLP